MVFSQENWIIVKDTYPYDVKAIAAAWHDIGNLSENHKQMSQLSKEECKDTFVDTCSISKFIY